MNSRMQGITAFVLIFAAAFSRLIPHPMNFAPVAAIALFGGVYFGKKFAFVVPIAALVISDIFIGFYSEIVFVYAGFILAGFIGLWLKNHRTIPMIAGATLASSILFFIITNYGSWLAMPDIYARSIGGLINCYVAALPFFRNSLVGDVVYVTAIFGVYEIVAKFAAKREAVKV